MYTFIWKVIAFLLAHHLQQAAGIEHIDTPTHAYTVYQETFKGENLRKFQIFDNQRKFSLRTFGVWHM